MPVCRVNKEYELPYLWDNESGLKNIDANHGDHRVGQVMSSVNSPVTSAVREDYWYLRSLENANMWYDISWFIA